MFFAAFEKKWWKSFIGESSVVEESVDTLESKMEPSTPVVHDTNYDSKNLGIDTSEIFSDQEVNFDTTYSEEQVRNNRSNFEQLRKDKEKNRKEKSTSDKSSNNRPNNNRHSNKNRQTKDTRQVDDSEQMDNDSDEVYSNVTEDFEQLDPLAPAFDLDNGGIIENDYDTVPSKVKNPDISNVKDFFGEEILYRYDILPTSERLELEGRYRIEVKGAEGGVWSLNLSDNDIKVSHGREDADLVLMLHQDDLLNVVNGKLNPQIALISQRIKVSGNSRKASLLQNLLSPYVE